MPAPSLGLFGHANFMKLLASQTVSQLGFQLNMLVLPLLATLSLHATPAEMGLMVASETAPFLLFGLVAGVWVDRTARRPILLASSIGRVALLAGLAALAWRGGLGMAALYAAGFGLGVLSVFYDVAYQSLLPAMVDRVAMAEGNSKLEASRSLAMLAGPGLGGLLIQAVGAGTALVANAAAFLVSTLCLAAMRVTEQAPPTARRGMAAEIREGLAVVLGHPLLGPIAATTALLNFFESGSGALVTLYLTRELGMAPAQLGLVMTAAAPGGLVGAVLASRLGARWGIGRTLIGTVVAVAVASALTIAARGSGAWAPALVAVGFFVVGGAGTIYNVLQLTLRQRLTPDRLLGRMNATMRFLVWGVMPLGGLLGGTLGQAIGVWPAMACAAAGLWLAVVWLAASPVRSLSQADEAAPEPAAAALS